MMGGPVSGGDGGGMPEFTSLLNVIADPKAAQERLQALANKAAEAKKAWEDASAVNKQTEVRWNDIKSKEIEIDDKIKVIDSREKGLEARETALAKRLDDVVDRENAADAKTKELSLQEKQINTHIADVRNIIRNERNIHAQELDKGKAVAKQDLVNKKAEADALLKEANDKMAQAHALHEDAQAKNAEITRKLADLDQKISKLKELMQ